MGITHQLSLAMRFTCSPTPGRDRDWRGRQGAAGSRETPGSNPLGVERVDWLKLGNWRICTIGNK